MQHCWPILCRMTKFVTVSGTFEAMVEFQTVPLAIPKNKLGLIIKTTKLKQ